MSTLPDHYQELVDKEKHIWSENARLYTQNIPPDWRFMRREYNYRFVYRREIERLLDEIQPGQRVLEIGCSEGWLALEIARRGAEVDACDIAEGALQIGQEYYEECRQKETIPGTLHYFEADVNTWNFPTSHYDWILIRGTLHHIIRVHDVLLNIQRALKPGGGRSGSVIPSTRRARMHWWPERC